MPLLSFGGLSRLLAFMRPDLEGAMWDHLFGWLVLAVMLLLSAVAAALTRLVFFSQRAGLRVGLALLIQAIAVFAAVFLALFTPIIFAFMYGQEGSP